MKRQYLGDSKDSFKWDYHDFLARELGCKQFQIMWMMTTDDGGSHGNTPPERFPARPEIVEFCKRLRETRDPGLLTDLPSATGARYKVRLHNSDECFANGERALYFSELQVAPDSLLFLDPDNGFEPEKSCARKHVRYGEVAELLRRTAPCGVISVFQNFRRRAFDADFARIRERLDGGYSTAIFWHSLMFVCISSSSKRIGDVLLANRKYAESRPVTVLA